MRQNGHKAYVLFSHLVQAQEVRIRIAAVSAHGGDVVLWHGFAKRETVYV
jgi:hypothetical protein